MHDKKIFIKPIAISVAITILIMSLFGTVLYFSLRTTLTIVFYDVECVNVKITDAYTDKFVCTYVRLNTENNHVLNVNDFSILNNSYEKAVYVEYFDQTIRTEFKTYPNQPILKVYFRVPHSVAEKVVFIKYKDKEMRIGEFVQVR